MSNPANASIFGRFRLERATQRLLFDGSPRPLKPKAFDLLLLLVENNGRVLSKEEVLATLWPGRYVEEAILTQNVYEVRRALATADGERFIENVPRRGYRFVADVSQESTAAPDPTLAVLPFRCLDRASEHVAFGVTEALAGALAAIRRVTVRPATAAMRHLTADRDPFALAQELRARYVVDGSVQTSGERVRVAVTLLDAPVQTIVWGDRFDGDLSHVFELQDAIAESVVAAVGLELAPPEQKLLRKRSTENALAYEQYMKGRYGLSRATPDGLWRALDFFREAVSRDPSFPLAWVGISDTYTALDWYGVLSTKESNPHAITAARRALELEDTLAEAHASLARALQYAWEWEAAEREYRIAIALNSELATARQWYAMFLAFSSRFDEALAQMRRARAIDPADPAIAAQLGLVLVCARRYDEAAAELQSALSVDVHNTEARFSLGIVEVLRGNVQRAIEIYRALPQENPDFRAALAHALGVAGETEAARLIIHDLELASEATSYIPPFWLAVAQIGLGALDAALASLSRACDDPDDSLLAVKVFAIFDPIRHRPEFETVLRRMRLA